MFYCQLNIWKNAGFSFNSLTEDRPGSNIPLWLCDAFFLSAPDEYTYQVKIKDSDISDILPDGTILTFHRQDIAEEDLMLPAELGELIVNSETDVLADNQRWVYQTDSGTASERDFFFDVSSTYADYENANGAVMAGRIVDIGRVYNGREIPFVVYRDASGELLFCDENGNRLFICGLTYFNTDSHYIGRVRSSEIPETLPEGYLLKFSMQEISEEELYVPAFFGEKVPEAVNEVA